MGRNIYPELLGPLDVTEILGEGQAHGSVVTFTSKDPFSGGIGRRDPDVGTPVSLLLPDDGGPGVFMVVIVQAGARILISAVPRGCHRSCSRRSGPARIGLPNN